ncbi:MAG: hypothetical protein ABI461_01095 [Polyangiaceae bacterium]
MKGNPMNQDRRHKEFPKTIARLSGLEGGQYGEIFLKANTRHRLELDMGNDFVLFDRAQATDLLHGVQRFLALDEPCDDKLQKDVESLDHAIEKLAEDIIEAPPRRRRSR